MKKLRGQIARSTLGLLLLRALALPLGFATTVLLARSMGAAGLGTYRWATALAGMLVLPSTMGQDRLIVRSTAVFVEQRQWGLLGGAMRWAYTLALVGSLGSCLIFGAIGVLMGRDDPMARDTLLLSLLLVPLLSLTRVRMGILKGLRRVGLSETPEQLLRPVLLFLACGAGYLLVGDLTPIMVVGFGVLSVAVTFVVGTTMLLRRIPPDVRTTPPQFERDKWTSEGIPLMFWSAMNTTEANADILMLGTIAGAHATGVFAVADKMTSMLMFPALSLIAASGPEIARLHAAGDTRKLQRLITRIARVNLVTVGTLCLATIILGRWILGLFGTEFVAGYVALVILCLGRMIAATGGGAGNVLVMTGHQNHVARAATTGVVVNVLLNLLLIPRFGWTGAALSSFASVSLRNMLMMRVVLRKTPYTPTAFPGLFGRMP